ncbi:MAG: polyprenyl synthetase family protein [Actinomycetota bacterium]
MQAVGGYPEPVPGAEAIAHDALRARIDHELVGFLLGQRTELETEQPEGVALVDELLRLVRSGGKRIRPALCYWGSRAAGGQDDERIVRAAAALELLHTFALVHDDVMDRSPTRRGVETTHERFGGGSEVESGAQTGVSIAILVGDLAAVLADRLFGAAGYEGEILQAARRRYDRMRVEMAVGQFLDLSSEAADEQIADRISSLKTGSYTVEGPLQIGALLAGARIELLTALSAYGRPLGEAFQVRDDLLGVLEGEADLWQERPSWIRARARETLDPATFARLQSAPADEARSMLRSAGVLDAAADHADELIADAMSALRHADLAVEPAEALREIAQLVGARP